MTNNLEQLKKERDNTKFLLNEVLNEKNSLQKEYNEEANPLRPLSPEEEAYKRKWVKINRLSLLLCIIVSFAGFGVILHLATYGIAYQVEMAIGSGCIMPFFLYGVVIFFFCDFQSFRQIDYEHENQFKENKPRRIRRRKPSKRAIELASLIREKKIEYNTLYEKLCSLENEINELEK